MSPDMIVKELLSQLQSTFTDAGAWFAELSCKLGLSSNCVYQDWKDLGSGLIDHIQKITVAAMQIADMKVCAHRS